MEYSELIQKFERKWESSEYDLEGQRGYILVQSKLYYWTYFYGEPDPKIEQVFEVFEFQKHSSSADLLIQQVVLDLQGI
jgi:hypothetical protein